MVGILKRVFESLRGKGAEPRRRRRRRASVFAIDLNARDMESMDAVCLLAGLGFKDGQWYSHNGDIPYGVQRIDLASLKDDALAFVNEQSRLGPVEITDYINNRDKLHKVTKGYQELLLDRYHQEKPCPVKIVDLILVGNSTILTLQWVSDMLAQPLQWGDRIALLGSNLQLRYIIEVQDNDIEEEILTGRVLGINPRAVKSRYLHLVTL